MHLINGRLGPLEFYMMLPSGEVMQIVKIVCSLVFVYIFEALWKLWMK